MQYYVHEGSRMVRTFDGSTCKPPADWREVTLAEWEAFRKDTKKGKKK